MATHSDILAWKIPWTEEPGGLQSMMLQSIKSSGLSKNTVLRTSLLGCFCVRVCSQSLNMSDALQPHVL